MQPLSVGAEDALRAEVASLRLQVSKLEVGRLQRLANTCFEDFVQHNMWLRLQLQLQQLCFMMPPAPHWQPIHQKFGQEAQAAL